MSRDAESRADTPDQGPDEGAAAGAGREVQGREVDRRDFQAEADRCLADLLSGLAPDEAALALALLANRAATRLHTLARAEASARKTQPDWPTWAQLQNASRTLVLQSSTCRDLARRLTGSQRQ